MVYKTHRACKKVPFVSRREALTAKKHARRHFGKVYKCPICGFYHMGNLPVKKSKEAIKLKEEKWLRPLGPLFRIIDRICGVK